MKIRTQIELQDFLDAALAVRKRELTTFKFLISQSKREHEKAALYRASVPLLYSHWEGFIKLSSIAYLDYVSRKRTVLKDLKSNFIAVSLREKLLAAANSKKTMIHEEVIKFILDNLDHNVSFEPTSVIETESNLSSTVLKNIMHTVGLDFDSTWQKKITIIDQKLVKHRNEIAHGEMVSIDDKLYSELHTFVLESIEHYKTAIENAASISAYKKTS